jgi:hypothetical protein
LAWRHASLSDSNLHSCSTFLEKDQFKAFNDLSVVFLDMKMSGFFSSLSRSLSEEVKAYTNAHPIRGRMLGASTNSANSDPMSDGEQPNRWFLNPFIVNTITELTLVCFIRSRGRAEPKLEPVRVHPVDRSHSLPAHLVPSGSISGEHHSTYDGLDMAGAARACSTVQDAVTAQLLAACSSAAACFWSSCTLFLC